MMTLGTLVAFLFVFQVATVFASPLSTTSASNELVTSTGEKIDVESFIEEITPKDGFQTEVRWGEIVTNMISAGVLDPVKLEDILVNRYGQEMKPEWRAVLAGENSKLTIDNDNAVFMMYLLWTFAKHNANPILDDSALASYFTNYDIGVGRAGYSDTVLLSLTPDQQELARSVSANAYRPCCGNSTAEPDCSHGYSALGLVQLMASQGFSKDEIFETFVQFNSFWFPETYIKNAMYFKLSEGLDWEDVSKELIAGQDFSSLRGSFTAKNYLQANYGI